MDQFPQTIFALVVLLGSPGFIGSLVSNFLEVLPAFQKLDAFAKFVVVSVFCIACSTVSYALATFTPPEIFVRLDPWYSKAVPAITLVAALYWHEWKKKKGTVITTTALPIDETSKQLKG